VAVPKSQFYVSLKIALISDSSFIVVGAFPGLISMPFNGTEMAFYMPSMLTNYSLIHSLTVPFSSDLM